MGIGGVLGERMEVFLMKNGEVCSMISYLVKPLMVFQLMILINCRENGGRESGEYEEEEKCQGLRGLEERKKTGRMRKG